MCIYAIFSYNALLNAIMDIHNDAKVCFQLLIWNSSDLYRVANIMQQFQICLLLVFPKVTILHTHIAMIRTKKLTMVQFYWLTNRLYLDFTNFSVNTFFFSRKRNFTLHLVVMSLCSPPIWQFLIICLSWLWHFLSVLVSYCIEAPSIWACLAFPLVNFSWWFCIFVEHTAQVLCHLSALYWGYLTSRCLITGGV